MGCSEPCGKLRSDGINSFLIMITPGFLAGAFRVNEENSLRALVPSGSSVAQALIYFGALLVVALGFFAWAIIFRRQRHRRHSHHPQHSHHSPKPASKPPQPSGDRPHNRTLAEAGGLPPVRTEKQPPSPV
jgi:ABC-type nickel/cobalt efflux system permease component RcnA